MVVKAALIEINEKVIQLITSANNHAATCFTQPQFNSFVSYHTQLGLCVYIYKIWMNILSKKTKQQINLK